MFKILFVLVCMTCTAALSAQSVQAAHLFTPSESSG